MLVVRQPHQPRPQLGMTGHHHELEVIRAVVDRQRAQQRPCQVVQFVGIASDEAESRLGPQAQHLADAADFALLENEIPQRPAGDGFEFLADRDFRPLQRHRGVAGLLDTDPEAHIEEIRITRAALPHPRPTDDGVQLLRIAVYEQLATALVLGGALDFVTILVELAQIDTALLFLLAPRDPAPTSEASTEHQRAEPGQAHHREEARTAAIGLPRCTSRPGCR